MHTINMYHDFHEENFMHVVAIIDIEKVLWNREDCKIKGQQIYSNIHIYIFDYIAAEYFCNKEATLGFFCIMHVVENSNNTVTKYYVYGLWSSSNSFE